jgi:hypothetical protein
MNHEETLYNSNMNVEQYGQLCIQFCLWPISYYIRPVWFSICQIHSFHSGNYVLLQRSCLAHSWQRLHGVEWASLLPHSFKAATVVKNSSVFILFQSFRMFYGNVMFPTLFIWTIWEQILFSLDHIFLFFWLVYSFSLLYLYLLWTAWWLSTTVPWFYSTRGTVHVEGLRVRGARVAEALGTPAAGLRPRPAREKGFPSNLLLHLIDTSPLFK